MKTGFLAIQPGAQTTPGKCTADPRIPRHYPDISGYQETCLGPVHRHHFTLAASLSATAVGFPHPPGQRSGCSPTRVRKVADNNGIHRKVVMYVGLQAQDSSNMSKYISIAIYTESTCHILSIVTQKICFKKSHLSHLSLFWRFVFCCSILLGIDITGSTTPHSPLWCARAHGSRAPPPAELNFGATETDHLGGWGGNWLIIWYQYGFIHTGVIMVMYELDDNTAEA